MRVPRGVFIDGESWGGRFVSPDQLIAIAAAADVDGALAIGAMAEREELKAAREHQRTADRYVDDPSEDRQAARLYAKATQDYWQTVRETAREFVELEPARTYGVPSVPIEDEEEEEGEEVELSELPELTGDRSDEWEIGLDYNSEKGIRSDVDINIRIRRTDGAEFGLEDAKGVLSYVRQHQETPDGYEVAGISWRQPWKASPRWTHGDVSDMASFWAPMYSRDRDMRSWKVEPSDDEDPPDTWRFGSVKH